MKSSNSVLLIEFDAVIAIAIKSFLINYGYEVTVASDAASAIRLLQIKGIDLILCDLDRRKYQLQTAVGSVELTQNEAVILQNLIEHIGAVVRREVLYAQIDTYGFCNSNRTVDVHVSALRKKVKSY